MVSSQNILHPWRAAVFIHSQRITFEYYPFFLTEDKLHYQLMDITNVYYSYFSCSRKLLVSFSPLIGSSGNHLSSFEAFWFSYSTPWLWQTIQWSCSCIFKGSLYSFIQTLYLVALWILNSLGYSFLLSDIRLQPSQKASGSIYSSRFWQKHRLPCLNWDTLTIDCQCDKHHITYIFRLSISAINTMILILI